MCAEPREPAPALAAGEPSGAGRGALGALRGLGSWLASWPRPVALAVALAWMFAIFALSEQRGTPGGFSWSRVFFFNLGHAPLFGLLGLWFALAGPRASPPGAPSSPGAQSSPGASGAPGASGPRWPRLDVRSRRAIVLCVVLYGVSDELHQSFVGGRSPSVLDLATNATGAWWTLAVGAYAARPDAHDLGLFGRLALGTAACLAAAGLATLLPHLFGDPLWL